MTNLQDLEVRWAAQQLRQEQANARNQAAILDAFAGLGIEAVEVSFDGCGDSGQIGDVAVQGGAGSLAGAHVPFEAPSYRGDNETGIRPLTDAVECLCYGLLEIEHSGWENNDGAFGTFTFDVSARSIELEFNGRHSSYETSYHTFAGEA